MKKTIAQYLAERKDMACHNLYCYSKTYEMNTPLDGVEREFAAAKRDLEIVDELIRLTEEYPTSDKPDIFKCNHESVKVRSNGIKFQNNTYMHPSLLEYIGRSVCLEAASNDSVAVYSLSGKFICQVTVIHNQQVSNL